MMIQTTGNSPVFSTSVLSYIKENVKTRPFTGDRGDSALKAHETYFHVMTSSCVALACVLHRKCTLTHWGRVTHICVSKLIIIGSDNGLSPRRRQAVIWTNAGILSIGPLRTKFSEIVIEILRVSFKKMRLKGSSAKWRPFCIGLNVLISQSQQWSLLFHQRPFTRFPQFTPPAPLHLKIRKNWCIQTVIHKTP